MFARVAASTWREAWPAGAENLREIASSAIATEKLYDTRIEILDPTTGRVVVQGSLEDPIITVLSGNRVATYVVDADGIPHMNIVSLRVREP